MRRRRTFWRLDALMLIVVIIGSACSIVKQLWDQWHDTSGPTMVSPQGPSSATIPTTIHTIPTELETRPVLPPTAQPDPNFLSK